MSNPTIELLATRTNPIYSARKQQMEINYSAYIGGRDYTKKRLTRFPNENNLNYYGGTDWNGQNVVGRVSYTPDINWCPSIVQTITDLVFMQPVERTNQVDTILSNIDGRDNSIDDIMRKANDYVTVFGYAWLKVDAPKLEAEMTMAEKEELDLRPFAYTVNPLNVVDWSIGKKKINWVLEEDVEEYSASALEPLQQVQVRRLWEAGRCTIIKFLPKTDKRKKQEYAVEVIELSVNEVPWVLVGDIPDSAHSFDSIESINKHILDLESSQAQVFIDQAFPREFVSEKTFERLYNSALSQFTLNSTGNALSPVVYNESAALKSAFSMAVGTKYPIILGEGDSPYTPSMPTGLDAIRNEIAACVENLQQLSGVALRKQGNSGESFLSKIFDAITVRGLIKSRAKILQSSENWVSYLFNAYDPTLTGWQAIYTTDLVVGDSESIANPV